MFKPRTALSMEQLRLLAVSMFLEGMPVDQIASALWKSERSVWRWVRAWRGGGNGALTTRRGWGRPPKLDSVQAAQVLEWLEHSPVDFGFVTERWTAPRLAAAIEERLGVRMNHRYLNDWLSRHGITPQIPQRLARERNESVIAEWISQRWPVIKKK